MVRAAAIAPSLRMVFAAAQQPLVQTLDGVHAVCLSHAVHLPPEPFRLGYGYGWRDITTTSLLLTPLASDSHRPSGDHAKLKIFPVLK